MCDLNQTTIGNLERTVQLRDQLKELLKNTEMDK